MTPGWRSQRLTGANNGVGLTAADVSWILAPTQTSVRPAALDPHSPSAPPVPTFLQLCLCVCVITTRLTWADWRRWLPPDRRASLRSAQAWDQDREINML